MPASDWMPLTLAQLDFWEEFCFHPDQPVSTVAHYVTIDGPADADALAKAIAQTASEAEALALRFEQLSDGSVRQRVDPDQAPRLIKMDLRGTAAPVEEAMRRMQADFNAVLDLRHDPIAAQWLIRTGDQSWIWYNRGHHAALDGYSMLLLEQRCARLYRHFIGKGPAGKPFEAFASFIEEDQKYAQSPRITEARAYWTDYLSEDLSLPVLQKGGEDYATEGLTEYCPLPDDFTPKLMAAAERFKIGWPDLLVLVSGAYLEHHLPYDGDALPLWLPYMSRMGSVTARVPCLAVNILPLVIDLRKNERLAEYIARLTDDLRQQRKHGRYRVEQLAFDRGINKGQRFFFSPLVNILPFDSPEFDGCLCERHVLSNGPADGFNITFRSRGDGSDMSLYLEADPAMTSVEEFERHKRALPEFVLRALEPVNHDHGLARLLNDAPESVS